MEIKKISWQTIIIGLLSGLAAAGTILLISRPNRGTAIELPEAPPVSGITVDMSGAVSQPGVYQLPSGSRVEDAIETAGGLLPEAYAEVLNQAAPLSDGSKVLVPFRPEESEQDPESDEEEDATRYGGGFPININTASKNTLNALPGIGDVKAQAIIDYRTEHGPFTDPEQLMDVSGIGPATYEKLKDLMTIY